MSDQGIFIEVGMAFLQEIKDIPLEEKIKALETIYSTSFYERFYFHADEGENESLGWETEAGSILRALYDGGLKGVILKSKEELDGLVEIAQKSAHGVINNNLKGIFGFYELSLDDKQKLLLFGAEVVEERRPKHYKESEEIWGSILKEAMRREVSSVDDLRTIYREIWNKKP